MRRTTYILLLLALSMNLSAQKVATGDILMVSYEQHIDDKTAVLTLRNTTDQRVTYVRAKLTYMDESGKSLGKDEIRNEVNIMPHSTAQVYIKAPSRANLVYYMQKSEAPANARLYMVAFMLKDYRSEPVQVAPTDDSPTLWHVLRIGIGVIILLLLGLVLLLPVLFIKKRKKTPAELVLLVMGLTCTMPAQALNPSGTLPVVYVNTFGQPITDKETYINGTIYIDNLGLAEYDTLGTAANPRTMQIHGRGNWTWTGFDKKPYKIKLDVSAPVLGMPSGKRWALMAGADDNLGFLRNTVGYMLSETIGLRWTPHQVPVELVLNGSYEGLYFLTETIRIQPHRIDVARQPDNNTNPDSLFGGWLLEIDNYSADGQIHVTEGNGQNIAITVKTPDTLSVLQRNYITAEMQTLNAAIYEPTSAHWEQLIELDELARFYLVQEIIENTESFHGSCFFYRDTQDTAKWMFGPVWDFGNSFWRHQERFVYDGPSFPQYWIGQLASFPRFQTRVQELWHTFYTHDLDDLHTDIQTFCTHISQAAQRDAERWRRSNNVRTNGDMDYARQQFMNNLNWRVGWLYSQWGTGIDALPETPETNTTFRAIKRFENGQLVIIRNEKKYTPTGLTLQ